MLVSLADTLSWLDVESTEFVITANNNILYFKYDAGTTTACTLTAATYTGTTLATHLTSVLNTALSSTLTITWSSTTYKFTITEAAHTIQYINSGSTAGYDIGFTADSSAAVSIASDTACSNPSDMVSAILTHVDDWAKSYCKREFESATYSQTYSGNGTPYLFLQEYPVTAISRVAIGREEVFSINNSTTSSYATCSCDGTTLTLNLNGSASTITLATYATMTLLVAAINAVGSNWTATLSNSDYGAYLSSEILPFYGLSCLDNDIAYIEMRDSNVSDFTANLATGELRHSGLFSSGYQNVFVNYTAGYSTIPEDLKMAVKMWVQFEYNKYKEDNLGMEYYSLGDVKKAMTGDIPMEVKKILGSYRRYML